MSSRPIAALAAVLFFASAAHAGTAEELAAAINKCAAIADDATRHACYDRLPTLVKSLAPVAAADAPPPAATRPTDPPPNEEKGFFAGVFDSFGHVPAPVPVEHVTAMVESFKFDYGNFVVTLDNGQVWRQVAATGDLVPLSRDNKDKVTIWRNSFGDYVLKINDSYTLYRVKRIR